MTERDGDELERVDFRALITDLEAKAPSAEQARKSELALGCEERDARLESSGIRGAITEDDWNALVRGELIDTHALRATRRWVNVRSGGTRSLTTLVLVGLTGRGKTLAGAWLLARLGGRYITAESLRRIATAPHWRERDKFEQYMAARVVVLDDAGTESDAVTAATAMYELVNGRQGLARGYTLITANIPLAEFRERYGERTVRRIEHTGAIIEVAGEDLRRRGT